MEKDKTEINVGDCIVLDHGDGCETIVQITGRKASCCWNDTEIYAEDIVDATILAGGCSHYSLPSNYRSGHHGNCHIALNVWSQQKQPKIWI